MKNYTWFISDLHLRSGNKKINKIFFDFLREQAPSADALYILGDLFVLWAGDDDRSVFHQEVKASLKKLSAQGTPVFLMPGNRDFLLGDDFAKESGCQILPAFAVINLYGRKTLLTHGDNLCGKKAFHSRFRALISDDRNKKLFLMLPLILRRSLAWFTHGISCICTKFKSDKQFEDKTREEAILAMRKYGVDQIIHGHIHKQIVEEVFVDDLVIENGISGLAEIGSGSLRRIVLGAWEERSAAFKYDAQ